MKRNWAWQSSPAHQGAAARRNPNRANRQAWHNCRSCESCHCARPCNWRFCIANSTQFTQFCTTQSILKGHQMGFTDAVRTCLSQKYATFSGRASRSEFWWYILAMVLIGALFGVLIAFSGSLESIALGRWDEVSLLILIPYAIFALGTFIPSIAVTVRRFHDRDMSGWWYLGVFLAALIPFVGLLVYIAFIVIMCLKGTDGPNRFGPDPLALHGGSDVFA
jgi:uncharacterized membrane protein YhaH (DUF805 family)